MPYTDIIPVKEVKRIKELLDSCGLPVEDIGEVYHCELYGLDYESDMVAVVGLQPLGSVALLRSLAVSRDHRLNGIGARMVGFAESRASTICVDQIYLLTIDAQNYFYKLGYRSVSRNVAPTAIVNTDQFSAVCPSSAILMVKNLQTSIVQSSRKK
ncbi:MAG: arsenic resistance N-acetyltransferase ArsN2 [Candidatus Thiodiazotropha sp.]